MGHCRLGLEYGLRRYPPLSHGVRTSTGKARDNRALHMGLRTAKRGTTAHSMCYALGYSGE